MNIETRPPPYVFWSKAKHFIDAYFKTFLQKSEEKEARDGRGPQQFEVCLGYCPPHGISFFHKNLENFSIIFEIANWPLNQILPKVISW